MEPPPKMHNKPKFTNPLLLGMYYSLSTMWKTRKPLFSAYVICEQVTNFGF